MFRGIEMSKTLLSFSSISFATCFLVSTSCPSASVATRFVKTTCRAMATHYSIEQHGTPFTENYKAFFKNADGIISPFHDIPFMADENEGIYNMVVEIPKWTNAKMEISTKDAMNPIKQDTKKGKVRFVKNVFPYKGYIWNYGAIPQTWENPTVTDHHTGQKGDGDPIDVVEIGNKVACLGEVKQVKVLGVMGLIDEGETDWKVIAIDVKDPLAGELNDIEDVKEKMPGLVEATHEWLKIYKMPAGSPANKFAFNGEAKNRTFAVEILKELNNQWKELIHQKNEHGLSCDNVSVTSSPYKIEQSKANSTTDGLPALTAPAELPGDVDKMYYLTKEQREA